MSTIDAVRSRAALTPFMSAAALEPRKRPLKTLWLGEMSSSLEGMAERTEPFVTSDIGHPVRLTMFRLLNYIETSFPRHVPWTMFPVVSEPFYEFKAVQEGHVGFNRKDIYPDPGQGLVEIGDIFDKYDAYAVEAHHGSALDINEELLRLSYALSCLADPKKPVYVRASGWEPPIMTNREFHGTVYSTNERKLAFRKTTAEEILNRVKPYAVLMYSYRLNFASIAMKALRAACFQASPPAIIQHLEMAQRQKEPDFSTLARRRSNSDGIDTKAAFQRPAHRFDSDHYWRIFRHVERGWERFKDGLVPQGLDHPFALQLLYALQRRGTVSCEPFLNSSDGTDHLFGELLGKSRWSGRYERSWAGTGKYPAVEFSMDKRVEASLLATGLVEIDHQAMTLSLSQVGEKFLNYLHPSCEDPDVIVRWIDANEEFFRPGSEEAISEWLTKFFRKMKTKVNGIPEHLTAHKGRERSLSKLHGEEWD